MLLRVNLFLFVFQTKECHVLQNKLRRKEKGKNEKNPIDSCFLNKNMIRIQDIYATLHL